MEALGALLDALGALSGRSLGALGALLDWSLALLGALGPFRAALETPGKVPRASREPLCDDFGTLWGQFGYNLGRNLGTI